MTHSAPDVLPGFDIDLPTSALIIYFDREVKPKIAVRPPQSTDPSPLHREVGYEWDLVEKGIRTTFVERIVTDTYEKWFPVVHAFYTFREFEFLAGVLETKDVSREELAARRNAYIVRRAAVVATLEWIGTS